MSKALDSIRVAIRVRPLLKRENGYKVNWKVENNTIFQLNDGKMVPNGAFTFDRIFDKDMATIDLYMDFAKSIVLSVMEGINGTLFAYGQTASGKTHTMSGDENSPGIIPHSLKEVFNYISETENREFLLRVSYMEIYNEVITDLLKPKHTNLKIHENAQKEVFVGDLTEQVVTSVEEIMNLMKLGERNRHFGCTNMNERSSRSHTIFRMVIESRETSNSMGGAEVDGAVKVSHLNLVDLAGSERASATGAEGIRLREGGFINKSLFALGNVINKLSEGESTFVPFRDSKLTRILQTSLGGNAKTSIICAITPASMDETLSTLQFASRAKTIKNRPEVNEVLDETTLLKRYRKEINVLKKQLEQFANTECLMELQTEKDKMEQQLLEQREEAAKQREQLRKLANFFCTAQPRETEKRQIKRNKRRWTVCPMGVQSQPPLQLALPSSFEHGFTQTNKRLKSNDNDGEPTSPDSADFHTDRLDRFFCEMSEREEDIEEFMPNAKNVSIRRSGSLLVTANDTSQEKRDSLAENVADERIEELKLELRRMTDERNAALEERDAIRNDLSENISSSCEIQEDLVNTKQVLREKKQKIRELQERLDQTRSRENLLDKNDEKKQATFDDMCSAKEDVAKKLAQNEQRALRVQLEAEAAAKDEAAKECQRLRALTQELENKVDLLTVVQSELESVDMLQVELSMEQEKNGALEGELRKKKDDYEELCEQMKRLVEDSTCFQHDLAEREEAVSQTNKKFDEAIENLQLLEEQNSKLRLQIEELSNEREGEQDSEALVLRQLQLRVEELEDENASLILKDRETEGKFVALQEELARNSTVVIDLKSSMEELVKERDEIVNEKAVEVSELNEKIMQLTRKLTRLKRRASHHSSIQTNAELESRNPDLISLMHDGTEDELTPQTKNDLTVSEDEADKTSEDVDGLLAENTKSNPFEELGETNSLLVEELEQLKQELLRKSSTVHDLEAKLSKMQSEMLEITCRADDESSNVLPNSDVELKERLELVEKELREVSETKRTLEEELSKATAVSETLKKRHEDEMDSLRKDFDEDLEKRKGEVDEKVFLIDELEVNLLEASEAKESLMVELESSQDQLAKGTEEKLQLAAILEEKSNAVEKLEGRLKDNEEMVSNLQIELQEQLERKDKELEDVKITVDELNGLLSKQGYGGCDEEEESKRATEELKETSREMAELQSELEEALVSKETFLKESRQRMADLQRKFDEDLEIKRGELEEKSEEIANLELQLEEALSCKDSLPVAQCKEQSIADPQKGFDDELERNSAEIKKEAEEISDMQKLLEETITDKQAFHEQHEERVAELQRNLNEALERKDTELQAKSNEIERLNEQLEQERAAVEMRSGKDHAVGESCLGDTPRAAFEDDLERMNAELQETSKTIEKLQIELQEALSSKEELQKKHKDFADQLQTKFRDELDQKKAELEEQMAVVSELQEKLQHVTSNKEASTDSFEDEITQLRKTFDAELEKKNAELEEQMAVVSELQEKLQHVTSNIEASTDSFEDEITQLRKTFDAELEKKNAELEEQMAVVSELQEKLQHVTSNIEASTDSFEDEITQLRKTFDAELEKKNVEAAENSVLRKALEEKLEKLIESHETDIADMKSSFDEEIQRIHAAAEAEKCNVINELEESLNAAIAGRDLIQRNGDESAKLQQELGVELQGKNEVINEKNELITSLEERIMELKSNEEEALQEHDTHIASVRKELNDELEKLRTSIEEKSTLCAKLEESLNDAIAARDLMEQNGDEFAMLRQELEVELQGKNEVINGKNELITTLEEQMMELKSAKEEALQEHDTHIASVRKELNDELEKMRITVEEKSTLCAKFEESLNDAIAARDLMQQNGDKFVTLRQELEVELQGKDDVINGKNELITSLEERIMELKSNEEEALQEHDTHIASVRKELNDELEKMKTSTDEKSTLCVKLEERLNDAIAARDLMEQNGDEFAMLRQELEVELQGKNEVINGKNELITTLEEQMMELKSAKEEALQEHDTHIASVRKELNDELEKLRTSIEEKSTLCAKLEEEKQAALSSQESLLSEHEVYIAGLKDDFSAELKRLNAVVGEHSSLVDHLEEKIVDKEIQYEEGLVANEELGRKTDTLISEVEKVTADLIEKTARIKEIDSELATALKSAGDLTEERDRLLGEYQSLEKELAGSRIDSETKSKEITALEKKARDVEEAVRALTEEKNVEQDGLLRKIERLERECEKLKEHVRELVNEKAGGTDKDGRISELTKQVEQLTKDCEMFTAEKYCEKCRDDGGKRRESLVFKSMLEDIKEGVTTENEDKKQDKLIDELSYTLMVTQEKLEQKEFVIDEKEIEILERDTQVQHAEENARKSQEFAKMQEEKLTELCAQIEHHKLSDQTQGALIEKLRKQLTQVDNTNKEEREKCCNLEKIVDKQRDEIEGYDRRVEELEAQKEKKMENLKDRNEYLEEEYERVMTIIDEMESEIEGYTKRIAELEAEQTENNKTVHMKNRNEYLEEEYERVMKIIDEMEAEIEGYTKKIEELEAQKENKMVDKVDAGTKKLEAKIEKLISQNESFAKREMESTGSSLRLSQELSTLKCKNEKLEVELKRLRDLSLVDLEEELQKVRNELKTKELDLYHVTYENTKQLDSTKSRIRELEKDRANYSRKNNELRTEIRRLRSQDDEPTIDIMKKQQTSWHGDTVGVVGSVALFTLDAKVAKLEEENGELKQKIEILQQKNDTLNIMSTDLKQRHSQVSEKYYKLKEQCAKNADAAKSRDHPKPTEQKPFEPMQHTKRQESELLFSKNPTPWAAPSGRESYTVEKTERKPTDQKPSEPMQHTRKQESQLLFNKQSTSWPAATSVKESHTVEKAERKPTVPQQNKENLFPQDKPDACKTQ